MWGDVQIIGKKTLSPDPQVMRAIGLNHSFESAVADIVDNSVDAKASKIVVRFVRDQNTLLGLYIADDGQGMNAEQIDDAMTLGSELHARSCRPF